MYASQNIIRVSQRPSKRWYPTATLYVTTQKTTMWIIIAEKTWRFATQR